MGNQKKKKKGHRSGSNVMGRSDIPFAERLAIQQRNAIAANREYSAKISMYCMSVALHELEGIGYKRIVVFSRYFKTLVDEMYADVEVGMAHAKQRMAQFGIEITGYLYPAPLEGMTIREQEVFDNCLQASQIAQICGIIAAYDTFGFGQERLNRIAERVAELSKRYGKEGVQFLLDEMEKIGFQIIAGTAVAYEDDNGNIISPQKAKKEGILPDVKDKNHPKTTADSKSQKGV